MKVLLTRPLKDSQELAQNLNNIGIQSIIEPLFSIKYLPITDYDILSQDKAKGFIFTSKYAAQALLGFIKNPENKICFVTGDITKSYAKNIGFQEIYTAKNNVLSLIKEIKYYNKNQDKLIYYRGNKITISLKEKLHYIDEHIVYKTLPVSNFSHHIIRKITNSEIGIITFFSTNTAKIFFNILEQYKIQIAKDLKEVTIAVISKNVRNIVYSYGLNKIEIFGNQDHLLDIIERLSKNERT